MNRRLASTLLTLMVRLLPLIALICGQLSAPLSHAVTLWLKDTSFNNLAKINLSQQHQYPDSTHWYQLHQEGESLQKKNIYTYTSSGQLAWIRIQHSPEWNIPETILQTPDSGERLPVISFWQLLGKLLTSHFPKTRFAIFEPGLMEPYLLKNTDKITISDNREHQWRVYSCCLCSPVSQNNWSIRIIVRPNDHGLKPAQLHLILISADNGQGLQILTPTNDQVALSIYQKFIQATRGTGCIRPYARDQEG